MRHDKNEYAPRCLRLRFRFERLGATTDAYWTQPAPISGPT
jgi:hypothetical protein